uniref:Uncharacterized protein n=1 Tax=Arundo donax TaxID=35708 RepID=A0A0A9BX77_ARUDO
MPILEQGCAEEDPGQEQSMRPVHTTYLVWWAMPEAAGRSTRPVHVVRSMGICGKPIVVRRSPHPLLRLAWSRDVSEPWIDSFLRRHRWHRA